MSEEEQGDPFGPLAAGRDPSQTAILSPARLRPRLGSGRVGVQPVGFS